MKINLRAFGIAKDILGADVIVMEVEDRVTVGDLQRKLLAIYPRFASLASLKIARNQNYADSQELIVQSDELVIIPPVCGG